MSNSSFPLILALDTSADDTSAAVVRGRTVLSNVVASQAELHKTFGGIFPTVAKQAHRENVAPTVALALRRANVRPEDLTAVAVTQGPGLAPALEVGITFAKEFAQTQQLPLLPINHIEGHLWSSQALPKPKTNLTSETNAAVPFSDHFPVLGIIVSGGHTEFILVTAPNHYQRLGWTIDDAAGEALDKFGRMVDLGYPAGPLVEQFAKLGDPKAYQFPLPMTTSGDFNVSFSGMKTAARNKITALTSTKPLTAQQVYDLCASFQTAVIRAITYKLTKWLTSYQVTHPDAPLTAAWLGGGVAANVALRQQLRKSLKPFGLSLEVPYSKRLCGDNAAMIGVVAAMKWTTGWQPSDASWERQPNLKISDLSQN